MYIALIFSHKAAPADNFELLKLPLLDEIKEQYFSMVMKCSQDGLILVQMVPTRKEKPKEKKNQVSFHEFSSLVKHNRESF